MAQPITIEYNYKFKQGTSSKFILNLNRETLLLELDRKPMVRFHLPFASLDETVFRMVSMHLLVQYYRNQEGQKTEWRLDGLTRVYAEVGLVNRDFAIRLRDAAKKDANINALVNLDCFAAMAPLVAEDTLQAIKPYFSAYL